MVARLSALRTGRTLLTRNMIIFIFLVLISVRDVLYSGHYAPPPKLRRTMREKNNQRHQNTATTKLNSKHNNNGSTYSSSNANLNFNEF
jgi:hypothetical protein